MAALLALLPLLQPARSHGGLAYPAPWQALNHTGWQERAGSYWNQIGKDSVPDLARNPGLTWPSGEIWNWFTNDTGVQKTKSTSCEENGFLGDDSLESRKLCDWMKNVTSGLKWILGKKLWLRPWMVPGSAPIFSPCGVNGGNPLGCPAGRDNRTRAGFNHCHKGGWAFGRPATDYGWPHAASTTWEAGSVQSTVWWRGQHHGGGYSYRLCRSVPGMVVGKSCKMT